MLAAVKQNAVLFQETSLSYLTGLKFTTVTIFI